MAHVAARWWNSSIVRKSENFMGHLVVAGLGFVMMVIGLAMGVTMVLLPVGLVVGLLGVLVFIGGLFGHINSTS